METTKIKRLPLYQIFNGFRVPNTFGESDFNSAVNYKAQKGDIFVATYPKCGTTWMCQIALLILKKGEPIEDAMSYFNSCPFFEYSGTKHGEKSARNINCPGCIKTHLPFDRITFSEEAKYIYVARHPADCVVSFYHHSRYFNIYRFSDGEFDDFFDLFLKGETDFNDYFDNLLSWYEQRHKDNIFFTTYEDMIADHPGTIFKVAEFLGKEYIEGLQKDREFYNKVLRYSSFDYMKKTVNNMFQDAYTKACPEASRIYECIKDAERDGFFSVGSFVRKGGVGEGKIVLSKEQVKRLNERILEKTEKSDVMSLWKK